MSAELASPRITPAATAPQQPRYLFIDLIRGAAILFMLEGHTFRALLASSIQQLPLYQLHELFHGITAPAFLFGAGLTFVISTRKRWEMSHYFSPYLIRRVGRMLLVILLGIVLHLPYFSLRKILAEGTTEDYLQLFQFDILHCIGIGLLTLQGLIFFFRTERRFYGLVLVAATSIPLLTPLVWDVDFLQHYPLALAQVFNAQHGSPFPLFPFVGFLFVGVIVSWEFLHTSQRGEERTFIRRLLWLGPVFIGGGTFFDALPVQLYPTYNFWYTSPNYFAIRVGALLLLTAGFWYGARFIESRENETALPRRLARMVAMLGKESLVVYVLHMPLLYGSVINVDVNIRKLIGTELGALHTTIVFVLFTTFMVGLAYGWNFLKTHNRFLYRAAQLSAAVLFFFFFLTRPY